MAVRLKQNWSVSPTCRIIFARKSRRIISTYGSIWNNFFRSLSTVGSIIWSEWNFCSGGLNMVNCLLFYLIPANLAADVTLHWRMKIFKREPLLRWISNHSSYTLVKLLFENNISICLRMIKAVLQRNGEPNDEYAWSGNSDTGMGQHVDGWMARSVED